MGARKQDSGLLEFDELDACLWRNGDRVSLAPKAQEVLRFLLGRPDRLVSKAELLDAVWPDTHVTEAVLSVAVAQLREALSDSAREPRFIETVHRRGYRWIGDLPLRSAAGPVVAPFTPSESAPLGREKQLTHLREQLEAVQHGERRVVFVTGESGIGKTAVVDTLVREATTARWRVARGQCVDTYGAGEAYMPMLEALEGICRAPDGRDAIQALRSEAPSWLMQMPGVLAPAETKELERLLASSSGERMVRELLGAVETLAAQRPLLLVLEDLHWSDRSSVALLGALASRRNQAKLLIVATLRTVDAIALLHPVVPLLRELTAKHLASELPLEGLTTDDLSLYLDARFPSHCFPQAFVERLQSQTAGNPLFVIHAIDEFLQRGWLLKDDREWKLGVEVADFDDAIPNSTREMIERRLEALPTAAQRILEAASLVGVTFQTPLVAAALPRDVEEVEDACSRLARDGVFVRTATVQRWPDGTMAGQYVFGHALYRQVLAARVSEASAAPMHQRIAVRLAAGYEDRSPEVSAQLALHYERSGDTVQALAQRLAASRVATRRNASAQAIEHLEIALDGVGTWAPGDQRQQAELELHAALLPPLFAAHGGVSPRFLEAARRIDELSANASLSLPSLAQRWALMGFHTISGQFAAGYSICDLVVASCDESPAWKVAGDIARGQRGFCRLMLGDCRGAVADLEASLAAPPLREMAPVEPAVMARGNLALAQLLLGLPDQAFTTAEQMTSDAINGGHAGTLSWASATSMRLGMLTMQSDVVLRAAEQATELFERYGSKTVRHLAEIGRCWGLAVGGDALGLDGFAAARLGLKEVGFHAFDLFHAAREAELLLLFDRVESATRVLEDAAQIATQCDERWCETDLQVARAQTLVRLGSPHARDRAQAAVVTASSRGDAWSTLRAATLLYQIDRSGEGDPKSAPQLIAALGAIQGGAELEALRTARSLQL
jgi:hypothetical protein